MTTPTIKYKNTNWFYKHIFSNMCSTVWHTIWVPSQEYQTNNPEVIFHEQQHVVDMSIWWVLSYMFWPWAKARWEARGYLMALWWLKQHEPSVDINQRAQHYVDTYFGWGPYLWMPLPKTMWQQGIANILNDKLPF